MFHGLWQHRKTRQVVLVMDRESGQVEYARTQPSKLGAWETYGSVLSMSETEFERDYFPKMTV